MAIFVSHGNATSKDDSNRISASASPTYILYGRRYVMSRRISLESYAFPKTSSSCMVPNIPLLAEEGRMRRAKRRRRRGGQTGEIFAELTTPALQPAAVAPPLLCEEGNMLDQTC